jgi:hypothetical protein
MRLSKATWLGAFFAAMAVPSIAPAHNDKHHQPDPALAARIAARTHYFGAANVDQRTGRVDEDKVIITWFSVQSYAVAARGRVFLLDSYIYRLADTPTGYVPTTVQELVDLKPEAIFIGHGHGDHADNAAYIATKTGARIFGAFEHCAAMQLDAVKIFGPGSTVKCTSLTTEGSAPGAEMRDIEFLKPDICIHSFKHLHSGPAPLDPDFPANPINPVRDPRVADLYPALPPPALDTRTTGGVGGSISMFYQLTFKNSDLSVIWHDTNGPIKEFAPQIIPILQNLPKADVELGSLVSIGETVNGVRDIAMYIQLVKPKYFYGGHSDNFNIGASPYYHRALQRQFEIFNIPEDERPVVPGFHDPYDYLRPGLATFSLRDPQWKEVPDGKRRARSCGGR